MVTVDNEAKESRIFLDGTAFVRPLPPSTLDAYEDVPSPITGIGSNTLLPDDPQGEGALALGGNAADLAHR